MKKSFYILSIVLMVVTLIGACIAQKTESNNTVAGKYAATLVSYNVENLFDTINDPTINDEEFTPDGNLKWNATRYDKKLNDLAKVITAINKNDLPAIVTLMEIENMTVLQDLANTAAMKPGNYGIVHYDSPDGRGIDVALMYRADIIKVLYSQKLPIKYPFEEDKATRDILYVKCLVGQKDTVHFYVNHWNSRREGNETTAPRRIYAATLLRVQVDSILKINMDAKIVITGDFNDTPTDVSLDQTLRAKLSPTDKTDLHNTLYQKAVNKEGSYNFKGDWNMLDNIIVSNGLLNARKGWKAELNSGQIFSEKWIMYENPKAGTSVPNKTYGGKSYFGGYSDHLPVYILFSQN